MNVTTGNWQLNYDLSLSPLPTWLNWIAKECEHDHTYFHVKLKILVIARDSCYYIESIHDKLILQYLRHHENPIQL